MKYQILKFLKTVEMFLNSITSKKLNMIFKITM